MVFVVNAHVYLFSQSNPASHVQHILQALHLNFFTMTEALRITQLYKGNMTIKGTAVH